MINTILYSLCTMQGPILYPVYVRMSITYVGNLIHVCNQVNNLINIKSIYKSAEHTAFAYSWQSWAHQAMQNIEITNEISLVIARVISHITGHMLYINTYIAPIMTPSPVS